MTKISIVGLGWLGLSLAKLLKAKGHVVVGSTTTAEKQSRLLDQGVETVEFSLVPFPQGNGFQALFATEVLVINIPPRSRTTDGEMYLEQLKYLRSMVDQSNIQQVLFVSSTGIYSNQKRSEPYTEDEVITSQTAGNIILLKGETLFRGCKESTIVRFGGLVGDDRIPGKYVAGRENVNGSSRVNYIYRSDAAKMLCWIIESELWNETFNGVAPIHPLRKDIVDRNVKDLGLEPPKSYLNVTGSEQRLVSSEKISSTGFKFDYPNPLDFPYSSES